MKKWGLFFGANLFLISGCNLADVQSAIQTAQSAAQAGGAAASPSPSSDPGSSPEGANVFCSYDVSTTYAINLDPTQDFRVDQCALQDTVAASTCDGVVVGDTQTAVAYSLARQGNTFWVSEGGDWYHEYNITDSTFSETATADCEYGYRVTRELVSGSTDSYHQTITVSHRVTYINDDACSYHPEHYGYGN